MENAELEVLMLGLLESLHVAREELLVALSQPDTAAGMAIVAKLAGNLEPVISSALVLAAHLKVAR